MLSTQPKQLTGKHAEQCKIIKEKNPTLDMYEYLPEPPPPTEEQRQKAETNRRSRSNKNKKNIKMINNNVPQVLEPSTAFAIRTQLRLEQSRSQMLETIQHLHQRLNQLMRQNRQHKLVNLVAQLQRDIKDLQAQIYGLDKHMDW
jgi:hypothetical protein